MNQLLRVTNHPDDGASDNEADDDFNDSEALPQGLLAELDTQQNDVLRQLDILNSELERLIREWSRNEDNVDSTQDAA